MDERDGEWEHISGHLILQQTIQISNHRMKVSQKQKLFNNALISD